MLSKSIFIDQVVVTLQQKQESYTVGDYMTPVSELYCATVNTTIDEGIQLLEFLSFDTIIVNVCQHTLT